MSDAQTKIAQFLQGRQQDPTAGNISQVLRDLQTNPDMIPGLRAAEPIYSAGDPSSLPTPPIPPSLQPRASAPAPAPIPLPPRVGTPTNPALNAGRNYNTTIANAINTGQPPPRPITGDAQTGNEQMLAARQNPPRLVGQSTTQPPAPVDDDPVNTGVAAKPFVPTPPTVTNQPNPQVPSALTQQLRNDDALKRAQTGNSDTSGPEGSYFRPTARGPVEVPQMLSQSVAQSLPPWAHGVVSSPIARTILDYIGVQRDDPNNIPFSQQTVADRIRGGTNMALGFAGGGAGARLATPERAAPKIPKVEASTPTTEPPLSQTPWGLPKAPTEPPAPPPKPATSRELNEQLKRMQIQRRIDQFNAGEGGGQQPPRAASTPTQATPAARSSPTAQAESPTTSNATPPINMGPAPTAETVPLAEIIRTNRSPVNRILDRTLPPDVTPPIEPTPLPSNAVTPRVDIPTPPPPFQRGRVGTSIRMQSPPTPIRGEVSGGETNAYNIPGTDIPITPTASPVATGRAPTSVPPPVNVPAPGATMPPPAPASPIPRAVETPSPVQVNQPLPEPMPSVPSAAVDPTMLERLQQLIHFPSEPVNVGGPRVIPIQSGAPMAQAVAQRAARGPRPEPTRATVAPELSIRDMMVRRLNEQQRGARR